MPRFHQFRVGPIQWDGHRKIVRLNGGRSLFLPRSACVTTGETVLLNSKQAFVRCTHGLAQIAPAYVATERIRVGALTLELLFKEITEVEEFDEYQSLANFHYRDQPLFGRTAKLIVQCFHPNYPRTIGYIELATPFYMSKPRSAVLNRPFHSGPIKWRSWDKETARRFINLAVRVARCVIFPEFRGIGLGQRLMVHAQEFARTRWQVGGIKPLFFEISADMLKYVPFAERAGLHYIGETEGNLKRVATDLAYLLQNRRRVKAGKIVRQEAFGIVDQQVARLDRASAILKENGWTPEELVERLKKLSRKASLRDLNLLQHVLSLPKPTYLRGLNDAADKAVRDAIKIIRPANGYAPKQLESMRLSAPIRVDALTINRQSKVSRTRRTAAVQRAFSISPDEINHRVIGNLSFSISPGQVVMVAGPSGSGKTTLLEAIKNAQHSARSQRKPAVHVPSDFRPSSLSPIRSQKPLIDALGMSDVSHSLWLMGTVGLSDAFIYLKKFEELSAGQQYRALLAKLIANRANVWIADEFCVNLDAVAANAVAERLGRLARKLDAIIIVATPRPELTAKALRPDLVVRLTTGLDSEVIDGSKFLSELDGNSRGFNIPSLKVDSGTLAALKTRCGKGLVIMRGRAGIRVGPLQLQQGGRSFLARAARVTETTLRELTTRQLRLSRYRSKKILARSLRVWNSSTITVLDIKPIDRP